MKKIMKALSLAVMLALLVPGLLNAQSGKTNFSGTWAFNAEKSNLGDGGQGGGRGFGGGDMKVTQEGNNLSVATTRPGRDGGDPVTTTMKYTLDGKESVNTSQRGESKSTATWGSDGKSLTIKTAQTFGDRTMNSTQVWTLNGANLQIDRTMTTQNGDMKTTMVYDKK
ncbi:MAG TPA: hypothetical protein VK207_01645 [Bacteroidales bacterium]|nr:hypothetical protein [Bacteroidales bacterium]